MLNKYKLGMQGQQEAESFLRRKGYQILEQNYRVRTGEIDLIAEHDSHIIFIEVKFRRGLNHGYPRESVGIAKQRKIIRTALYYISAKNLDDQSFRFDVIEVLAIDNALQINHIENAFDAY